MSSKNGVDKTNLLQTVTISVDKSNEEILQLNMDSGMELSWTGDSFRKLPEEVTGKLTTSNLKSYLKAEIAAEGKAKAATKVQVLANPFNPVKGNAEAREYIRPRKGWHQSWKNPGRDFDEAMLGPYKQVRKQAEGEKKEPGYETGEVFKRLDGEGKVEAIAVECREEDYKAYLEWMSQESSRRFTGVKSSFFEKTEAINRGLGRGERITPFDDSGELQA